MKELYKVYRLLEEDDKDELVGLASDIEAARKFCDDVNEIYSISVVTDDVPEHFIEWMWS